MNKKNKIKRTVIIYAGRFQPFGKHHGAVFMWIQNNFPHADPFIATTNVTSDKSPFNFNEKKAIISAYGFANKVIRVTDPYKATEILGKYDPKTTAVIFVVGKKDATRLVGGSYFIDYPDQKLYNHPSDVEQTLKPLKENGYVLITPHIKLSVSKYGEMSGTAIRKILSSPPKNKKDKVKLFTAIFGWYSEKLATMIFNKLKNLKEDKIPGGLADNKDVLDLIKKYGGRNQDKIEAEVIKGIKVEMEHTSDHSIAMEIAIDHLWEDLDYYTKLSSLNLEEDKLFTAAWWKDTINEGLVDHSTEELKRAGLFDKDSDYNGMIGNAVLELMKTFASQGHSGFSASWVTELFSKLSKYETLTPLTEDETEWMDVREMGIDTDVTLFQNRRNTAAFATNPKDKATWYHVDGKALLEYLNTNKQLYTSETKLLTEGGAASHMSHPFNLPNVKTGKQLVRTFVEIAKNVQKNPASVKIDGINTSLKVVSKKGKLQFALDRGSKNPLDVSGITTDDLSNRFPAGHGFIKTGEIVLNAWNKILPRILPELKQSGLINNPNKLLNIETVIADKTGKANVVEYEENFFVLHGILTLNRKLDEATIAPETIKSIVEKGKPIMKKLGYGFYGDIPTSSKDKIKFTGAMNTSFTVSYNKKRQVTKSLKDWLDKATNPINEKVRINGKLEPAMTQKHYMTILNKTIPLDKITTDPADQQKLINGAIMYHATRLLGTEILKGLQSELGDVSKHEGIVVRIPSLSSNPIKVTGEFLFNVLSSKFRTNESLLLEGGNVFKATADKIDTSRIQQADVLPTVKWLETITNLPLSDNLLGTGGKKETSGDLDLAVDEENISKDKLVTILNKWVTKNKLATKDYIRKSGDSVHFKSPINGDTKNGYVQVDFMFGEPEWMHWAMAGSPEDSKYKAAHKAVLLASLASFKGLKWSYKQGLLDRESGKLISKDPDTIAQKLLGSKYTAKNIESVEKIMSAIQADPNRNKIIKQAKDTLAKVYGVELT